MNRLLALSASFAALALAAACSSDPTRPPGNNNNNTDAPTIGRFEASQTTVAAGAKVTLTYEVSDASEVEITASPGGVVLAATANLTGMVTSAAITARTVFTLTATGDGGTKEKTVTVDVDQTLVTISSFAANPSPGPLNGLTTLTWTTAGATRVVIKRGAEQLLDDTAMAAQGSLAVRLPDASNTFTLVASNAMKSVEQNVTVAAEMSPVIDSFRVRPGSFTGASAMVSISWNTRNASRLTLTANGAPVTDFMPGSTATGTVTRNVTETTTFELTAISGGGMVRAVSSVAKTVGETEPNDDAASAAELTGGGAVGMIMPEDDEDWYKVTVPAGGNIFAETSDGNGSCAVDTEIDIVGTDGTTVLATNDDGGIAIPMMTGARCSRVDPLAIAGARNLAAGTYYVVVKAYAAGAYTLVVRVGAPACGNRIPEGLANEQCDDGNTMTGDGCDASCRLEATGMLSGPPATMRFMGNLSRPGQIDTYQVTMTAPGYIAAETFVPTMPGCTGPSHDTLLTLQAGAMVLGRDDDGGEDTCSKLDPTSDDFTHVQAGTYFIQVSAYSRTATIGQYAVEIRTTAEGCGNSLIEGNETCDDGNTMPGDGCDAQCQFEGPSEREPNNASGQATPLGMAQVIRGSIDPGMDQDWFSVTIPAGNHLEAFLTVGSPTRCNGASRGVLTLYGPNGTTELASDDFSGPDENCGRIAPDTATVAFQMAAGTYFLKVTEYDEQVMPNYLLHVRVVAPGCANTYREMGEQCDDGNTAAGDGCSPTCTLEISRSFTAPGGSITLDMTPASAIRTVKVDITQAGSSLTATTSDAGMSGACSVDTGIALLDANFRILGGTDTGSRAPCAGLDFGRQPWATDLAAGSYYLVVVNGGTTTGMIQLDLGIVLPTCGDGLLERNAGEQCEDGNRNAGDGCSATCRFEGNIVMETEPNNTRGMANALPITVGQTAIATGAVMPAADLDYFSFEVPAGAPRAVTVRTFTTLGMPTSCRSGVDTYLTLFDAAGMMLTYDDDGSGLCSVIDPTTSRPDMTGMRPETGGTPLGNLPPGRYAIELRAYDEEVTIAGYFVSVEVR